MGHRKANPLGLGYQSLSLSMPSQPSVLSRGSTITPPSLTEGQLRLHLEGLPFPADFQLRSSLVLKSDPTFVAFKRQVLEAQIRWARSRGRVFTPTIADALLDKVEHGQKMKKAAAAACRELLAAARAALDPPGSKHSSLRALSGYRSVEREQDLWDGYFEQYYVATWGARAKLVDGLHSEAAVQLTVNYVSDRKAAPGYGNHSAGIAMDFATTVGKITYGASMSQKPGWKKTPFFHWLQEHASEFEFRPYVKEPWHWEYKP